MNGLELHLVILQFVIVLVAIFMYYVIRKEKGRSTNRLLAIIIGFVTVCVMVVSAVSYRHYIKDVKYVVDYENVASIYLNGYEIVDTDAKKSIVEQFNGINNVERNADGSEAGYTENWLIIQLKNDNRIQILDMGNGEVEVQLGFPEYSKYDCFYTGEAQSLAGLISGDNNYKDVDKTSK